MPKTPAEIPFTDTNELLWTLGYLNAVLVLDPELIEAVESEVRRRGMWWWKLLSGTYPLMHPMMN
jgi:hypothetical protein